MRDLGLLSKRFLILNGRAVEIPFACCSIYDRHELCRFDFLVPCISVCTVSQTLRLSMIDDPLLLLHARTVPRGTL